MHDRTEERSHAAIMNRRLAPRVFRPALQCWQPAPGEIHLYESADQHGNWLECIRSRRQPIAPVEVAHRSCSACLLHHIAMKANRQAYWDPIKEHFKNDDEANAMLSRPMRAPHLVD
jgi:hypothetical protein